MVQKRNKVLLVFLTSALSVSIGCAHGVRMISVPAGAQISVDGKPVGKAPVLYPERSGALGRSYLLKADMGNQTAVVRKESVRICPTAANLLLNSFFVGYFFGFCLKDEYIFDFTQAKPDKNDPHPSG